MNNILIYQKYYSGITLGILLIYTFSFKFPKEGFLIGLLLIGIPVKFKFSISHHFGVLISPMIT